MANSGYKNWLTLKKYVNGVATTETKTNATGDADYIAPVLDTNACPTTSNTCPTLSSAISNVSANTGGVNQTINLNNHFNDLDGDTLTYTATSSNINAVTTSVASNILTLSFSSETGGSSTISVTASDGTCSADGTFTATVSEVSTACVTGLNSLLGVFSGTTSDIACSPTLNTATFIIYGNGTSITNSTNFYSTIDGCTTMPAGFYAQADPSDLSVMVNWVQLNSLGVKIDSGLCNASQPIPPVPTQYTSLVKCTDNTQNYYTTEIISSGISYYSNGNCYLTGSPIYDSAISGKTLVLGTQYAPNSNGPCDCDCYGINCGDCYGVSLGYSSSTICDQDTAGVYYLDDPDLCLATVVHTDTFCTQLAPSGYYSYASGLKSRYWNGTAFVGSCQTCEI
jgi:hypothetical protein